MSKYHIDAYIKIPISIDFQAASELAAREVWDNNTTLRRAVLNGRGWDNDKEHWAVIRETLYQTDIEPQPLGFAMPAINLPGDLDKETECPK